MRNYTQQFLQELYDDYIKIGYKKQFGINIPEGQNFTYRDVGEYMYQMGYVTKPLYTHSGGSCAIDIGGIEHIDPIYFDQHIFTVLDYMYNTNQRVNITAVLQFPDGHNERGMHVGAVMQRRDLIKAVQITGSGYVAEISPMGRIYYEDNQARFLDLNKD